MEAEGSSIMLTFTSPSTPRQILVKSQSSSSSSKSSIPTNTNFLADLSLKGTSLSSSSFYLLDTQSTFSSSMFSSSTYGLSLQAESGEKLALDGKGKLVKALSLKNGKVNKREPLKDSLGRFYPPPISCLKLFKTGKPYTYLTFNEEDASFVLDEVRIPNRDIFRASRADGRLKLYFDTSVDEFYEMGGDEH